MIERAASYDDTLQVAYHRLGLVLASTGSALDIEGVLNPAVTRDRDGKLLLYPRMVAAEQNLIAANARIGVANLTTSSKDWPNGFATFASRSTSFPTVCSISMTTSRRHFACERNALQPNPKTV